MWHAWDCQAEEPLEQPAWSIQCVCVCVCVCVKVAHAVIASRTHLKRSHACLTQNSHGSMRGLGYLLLRVLALLLLLCCWQGRHLHGVIPFYQYKPRSTVHMQASYATDAEHTSATALELAVFCGVTGCSTIGFFFGVGFSGEKDTLFLNALG